MATAKGVEQTKGTVHAPVYLGMPGSNAMPARMGISWTRRQAPVRSARLIALPKKYAMRHTAVVPLVIVTMQYANVLMDTMAIHAK